jgi:hypothetical protein
MNTKKLEQIRKLLELARSAGDSAEGVAARKKAVSRMESLGVTEEEVLQDRRVVLAGRVQIWQQAILEVCAEMSGCGLQVDRRESEWALTGSLSSMEEAQTRFSEVCRQLSLEASEYIALVRKSLRKEGEDPAELRACLEKMKRIFLEAAALSVIGRFLGQMLEKEESPPLDLPEEEKASLEDEPDRRKRPFEKLTDRVDDGAEFDWDLELSVDLEAEDPSTAGMAAGERVFLYPPWGVGVSVGKLLLPTG